MPEHQESIRYENTNKNKYGDGESRETLTLTRKSRGQSMTANVKLRGIESWKALMKSFSEANKETCKSVPIDLPLTHRSLKTFPTGSNYEGTWNLLGMSGEGTYTFAHKGVVYKGGFDDGAFQDGSLFYENGAIIRGKWNKGKLTERHLFFADGLEYVETDWAYCRPFDRRFTVEYDNGLEPADQTYKTAEQPTPPIPFGYYDVGDGLYDPATKIVYKYDDLTGIVRSPSDREAKWIEANCRVNPDLPKGPCPFLYEDWLTPTLEVVPEPPPPFKRSSSSEEPVDEKFAASQRSTRFSMMFENYIRMRDTVPKVSSHGENMLQIPKLLKPMRWTLSSPSDAKLLHTSNLSTSDVKTAQREYAFSTTHKSIPRWSAFSNAEVKPLKKKTTFTAEGKSLQNETAISTSEFNSLPKEIGLSSSKMKSLQKETTISTSDVKSLPKETVSTSDIKSMPRDTFSTSDIKSMPRETSSTSDIKSMPRETFSTLNMKSMPRETSSTSNMKSMPRETSSTSDKKTLPKETAVSTSQFNDEDQVPDAKFESSST